MDSQDYDKFFYLCQICRVPVMRGNKRAHDLGHETAAVTPEAQAQAEADAAVVQVSRAPAITIDRRLVKIADLTPASDGYTLTAKVLTALETSSVRPRTAECLIGDETGTIMFTARKGQVELVKAGNTVTINNGMVEMVNGHMTLAVGKYGTIKVTEPASFTVKEDNNLSLVEYESVELVSDTE